MVKKLYLLIYDAWLRALAKDDSWIAAIVDRLWKSECVYCTAWRAFLQGFGAAMVLFASWPFKIVGALMIVVVVLIVEGERRYVESDQTKL